MSQIIVKILKYEPKSRKNLCHRGNLLDCYRIQISIDGIHNKDIFIYLTKYTDRLDLLTNVHFLEISTSCRT